jgi:hypothetical protein
LARYPTTALWLNAVKERDVFLRFQEAWYPLVPGAMLLCDKGRGVDVAGEPDLRGIRIAPQQKRFWPGAAGGQDASQNRDVYPLCGHILDTTPPPTDREFGTAARPLRYSEAASISVSIS